MVSRAADGEALPPAAVWLVDNYAFLSTQIREVRESLPRAFYRTLPAGRRPEHLPDRG